ncbi:MAG: hypothetical protein EOP19_18635, partial [Hyphomicrobiales bacterium]
MMLILCPLMLPRKLADAGVAGNLRERRFAGTGGHCRGRILTQGLSRCSAPCDWRIHGLGERCSGPRKRGKRAFSTLGSENHSMYVAGRIRMMADNCSEADWRQLAEKALAGAPFSTLVSHSEDGIAYGPVYAEAAVRPILRGTLAPWSIAQRLDDPDPARANHQALADLDGGADALVLVLEGAPSAFGFGLPAAALETALAGVMLDIVHLRLEGGEDALAAAEGVAAIALAQGVRTDALDLDLCRDPLAAMAVAGSFPPDDQDLRRSFAA